MATPIRHILVLGAGSAGYLAAITVRRKLPEVKVTIVDSPNVPVIGVGESTTAWFRQFLHDELKLPRGRFFSEVRPIWKMGVRFLWGSPRDTHFNFSFDRVMDFQSLRLRKLNSFYCLEDWHDCGHYWGLMDRALAPCLVLPDGRALVQNTTGYHIDNKLFLAYLQQQAAALGVEQVRADVVGVPRNEAGDVECLQLADDRKLAADFFIDCSGFRSLLLGETLQTPYVSFRDSLFCDTAVVGSWKLDEEIQPFTTSETMDHGWCWRIEFDDHVTRGYVHSSLFCTPEQAAEELKAKNPKIKETRTVKFKSGRYENFWVNNVAAVGNASGFVEPLEATALHVIGVQCLDLCAALRDANLQIDSAARDQENRRFRENWDEIRDCLAMHFKYNYRSDTPFWQHCREKTPLKGLQPLIDHFGRVGPARTCEDFIPRRSMFAYNGYMILLLGLRVPTEYRNDFSAQELDDWRQFRAQVAGEIQYAVPMRRALEIVRSPQWRWE